MSDISCSFLLGLVDSPEHESRLLAVAYWLDQNKFSTTFSVIDGRALLDITPDGETPMTADEFRLYAAELVIHALCHQLRNP